MVVWIRTNVPIFNFVGGVNREFNWEGILCLCNSFLAIF